MYTYLRDRLVYRCGDKDERIKPWAKFRVTLLHVMYT